MNHLDLAREICQALGVNPGVVCAINLNFRHSGITASVEVQVIECDKLMRVVKRFKLDPKPVDDMEIEDEG